MDKVAYHFNKKKLRAKTDGKFLYYYPCNEEDKANTFLYGKGYFVIEVTEKEWEALFELDRFEYNNWHKVYRHNEPFPENEEQLSPTEQQKLINCDVSLAVTTAERIDRIRALSTLTKREREVYCLSVDEQCKQEDLAEELGITQGAVSSAFRRAKQKLDAYDLSKNNSPDDIVWKLWQIFMRDFELPDFLDVEIEFVIKGVFGDILPFINWFYSIGELCRYILRCYLFDEDKINADIEHILSGKLFCGNCGTLMTAEDGTSHTGKVYHYYKCFNRKLHKEQCNKSNITKEKLEDLVFGKTVEYVLQMQVIDKLAVAVTEKFGLQKSDTLALLEKEQKQVQKAIDGFLSAIAAGIVTKSTKEKLLELEQQSDELESKIAVEKVRQIQPLDVEKIKSFLTYFARKQYQNDEEKNEFFNSFIYRVVLFDDYVYIFYNTSPNTPTKVKLDKSDLTELREYRTNRKSTRFQPLGFKLGAFGGK